MPQDYRSELDELLQSEPARDEVGLPVTPRIQELPLNALSWENFERLCARLIASDHDIVDCHRYGVRGDAQAGIDIMAYRHVFGEGRREFLCYQCKRWQQMTPADLHRIVLKFTYPADRYVIMVSLPATAALRDVVAGLPNVDLWDAEDICNRLKHQPELVEDFFGVHWRDAFCGPVSFEATGGAQFPPCTPSPGPLLANLPLSYADLFVGREHELSDVLGPWMSKGSGVRAIAVTGIGGIGKTSLAVAAALRYQEEFPGGIVFVTARDSPGFGLEALFLAMDDALGTQLRRQNPEIRPALARARLNELRHLLVLDNLETAPTETIASIIDFLCTLDVREAGTLTLMTGRDMPEPFLGLAPRHHLPLDSLEEDDAINLLQRLAADTPAAFDELDGHWTEAAAQCYGHPLLIHLLVGLVQEESWAAVQRRMQALGGDVGQRVYALLNESITRLSARHPRAEKTLWSLGAFAGGTTVEALACVEEGISLAPRDVETAWNQDRQRQFMGEIGTRIRCVAGHSDILDQVSEALGLLCRGRLVERMGDRYDLHPLVRSYVRERGWSASEGIGSALQQSHAAYFLWYVDSYHTDYRALEQELSNIRIGFACACVDIIGDARMVFLYAYGMDPFLDVYGYWEEDLDWLSEWAEACQTLEDEMSLDGVYNNMGLVHGNMGNYSLAMECYQRALKGKEQSGTEDSSVADTYGNVGAVHVALGDFEQALSWMEKALQIEERIGNEERLCVSYNNVGMVYRARGAYDEALEWFEKGLAVAEKLGDQAKMAGGYNNVGAVYQARGEYDEALEWFEKGLALAEKLGDQAAMALGYNNVGEVYQARGAYDEALEWLHKGLALAEKLGDQATMAAGYSNIGAVCWGRGAYDEALEWVEKGLAVAEKLGDQAKMARGYNNIGAVYQARGEYDEALEWFEKGLALAEKLGDQATMVLGYSNLGSVLKDLGNLAGARAAFERALAIAEAVYGPEHPEVATDVNNLGSVLYALGDLEGARAVFERALRIFEQFLPPDHSHIRTVRGNLEGLRHST